MQHKSEHQRRLDREHKQFVANRKGKGRARPCIQRTLTASVDCGDGGKARVKGNAILIHPKAFKRDAVKALLHWCKANGITLTPAETITCTPPGVEPFQRTISYLAFGELEDLKRLIQHDYIGDVKGDMLGVTWNYVTNARVASQATTLAKGKPEKPPEMPHPHETALREHARQSD